MCLPLILSQLSPAAAEIPEQASDNAAPTSANLRRCQLLGRDTCHPECPRLPLWCFTVPEAHLLRGSARAKRQYTKDACLGVYS